MTRTVVGVLRGGPSPEYDVSLRTGAALMQALPEERYRVHDIFIDREGQWHHQGRTYDPMRILAHLDVAVNGLHGTYGEDGTVQRILERAGVPYTGPRPEGAMVSICKVRTRQKLAGAGVRMPQAVTFSVANPLTPDDMARTVFSMFGPPYMVKPSTLGSSVGIRIARSLLDLSDALEDMLRSYETVLVEEFIRGREATIGVIDQFRSEDHYALPAVEIIPKGRSFFDYEAKYGGACEERCPGSFSHEEKRELEEAARLVHRHIGLTHYSRSDFIVRPNGKIYFLEVNSLPGLTEQSLLPRALDTVGSSLPEFAEHIVRLAQGRV